MRVNFETTNSRVNYKPVTSSRKVSRVTSNDSASNSKMVLLSFTGKNMRQIASFTPENNGLGLPEAAQGGEGCVGFEAPESLRMHESMDARSFMPFWEHNNPKGGYKFMIHRRADFPDGFDAMKEGCDTMPASAFYSADLGEDKSAVAKKLGLAEDELSYVIQSRPIGSGKDARSKYCILEPTTIKGQVTRASDTVLGEFDTIPYGLFKISGNNPKYNNLKFAPNYFVYTPQLARASKPYSYDAWGNGCFEAEIINSDWMRAQADFTHTKMNTEEFGYFDPANVYCHDRVCHTYGNHIANMSAAGNTDVNGLKMHIWEHNPGRNYQGITDDPFKYFSLIADNSDVETLKSLPEFDILQKAQRYGIHSEQLSPRERQIARTILEPYFRPFVDGAGTYNVVKSGISAARINPDNISLGTVSYQFGKEMKNPETSDIAKFLTDDFASIETKDVVNGSTPANLELGDPMAKFGRDGNGLNAVRQGYTPFTYVPENELDAFMARLEAKPELKDKFQNITTDINKVIETRRKNAEWLTGLIEEAQTKGHDALKELFFNSNQISDGVDVLGGLSKLKDGEILVVGWGRADEQKGYPITTKGYLEFLKRDDVPKEMKLKVKVLIGAGPWDKSHPDYIAIERDLAEIATLDGGIYKNNFMYVNGFYPKRFVGCATHGMFTSRREMCGITPLECKAAGVPYGATATGGPVDYTNTTNGYLTKEPVELNPQHFGLSWESTPQEIDNARVSRQAVQVSDIFKEMIEEHTERYEDYVSKCKTNIEEKIDWHENAKYNHGKSANRRYLEDILEVDKGWEARNKGKLKRITGKFGEYKDNIEELMHQTKSKPVKIILSVVLGALAVGSGVYIYLNNKNGKKQTAEHINTAA